MAVQQKIKDLRHWDEKRPGFAGEHWLVFGAGLLAMRYAQRSHSTLGRVLAGAAGSALVARAASGRDGIAGIVGKLAAKPSLLSRLLPFGGRR